MKRKRFFAMVIMLVFLASACVCFADGKGFFHGSGSTATAGTGTESSVIFEHQTLYYGGFPVAVMLVPEGWSVSMNIDWEFISTATPGVANILMTSPDGHAIISAISSYSFNDLYSNGESTGEGVDIGSYMTKLRYRNAEEYADLAASLKDENSTLVEEYPVSEDVKRVAEDGARAMLLGHTGAGLTGVASEGTVADRHYRSGNNHLEIYTCVLGTHVQSYSSAYRVNMDMFTWNVLFTYSLATDSQENYDLYRPVFRMVAGNSGFTTDFAYVLTLLGHQIAAIINGTTTTGPSIDEITSGSGSWLDDYYQTNESDSDKWIRQWDDVIKEVNTYNTTDGGTVSVSTQYDSVYQDGDKIYMGPDSQAPDGWTQLEIAR